MGRDLKPHIGVFGRRNNGKSSFINSIINQEVSIVSNKPGTTTDPVKKSMEIFGIGPVVIIDTAGIDDVGELGEKRIKKTYQVLQTIDFGMLVIANNKFGDYETELLKQFEKYNTPFIIIHNKADLEEISVKIIEKIKAFTDAEILEFSTIQKTNIEEIIETIKHNIPKSAYQNISLFEGIIKPKDIVLLITPIDSEAPDGRMILPQVMSWRNVLDNDCICISVKETELKDFIKTGLKPNLVVTDSQAFKYVASVIDEDIPLTSFSIVFARFKGDLETYAKGTRHIDKLKDKDKILIMESCTHQVSCDDIGRNQIPKLLTSFTGKKLNFDFLSGVNSVVENISDYALIVQCGGCMATKKQIHNKINFANSNDVNITNYGTLLAYINGVFDRVLEPFENLNV